MANLHAAQNTQAYAVLNKMKNISKSTVEKPALPVITVLPADSYQLCKGRDSGETLQVSSTGEVILKPDICTFSISVSSKKDRAQDVKNSVARRFDYILQTLHNHHIKENEMTVSESLQRVNDGSGEQFSMDSQVIVCVRDTTKYLPIVNLLTEKLDSHVTISAPDFSHDSVTLEQSRRQASLLAVKNCKSKAADIAKLVSCRLGSVTSVREDSCTEWTDEPFSSSDDGAVLEPGMKPFTVQQRLRMATVHVAAKLTVTFELRSAHKSK